MEKKPWKADKMRKPKTHSSSEVINVHYAPYDDNLKLINDVIENEFDDKNIKNEDPETGRKGKENCSNGL